MNTSRASFRALAHPVALALGFVYAMSFAAAPARAQNMGGGLNLNGNPIGIGQAIQNSMGSSQYPGMQGGMSPMQLQQLMMLRGLQGMGHHHGVQYGAGVRRTDVHQWRPADDGAHVRGLR